MLVRADGSTRPLKRLELTQRKIHEGFLQQLVHEAPDILPVEDLDSAFGPLVSLGREMRTDAGFVDNVLINPAGRLTIVETKLWRNPQATREVVAQVLDYAKALRQWSYEELEQAVREAMGSPLSGDAALYDLMAEHAGVSEPVFVDHVQQSLSRGRFLLLVVGDGIRRNIEQMVDVLHTTPDLLFTFGLVELQLFEDESIGGRIVLPHVIARTVEIVRAVVRVEGAIEGAVSISIDESAEPSKQKSRLSVEEFFASLDDQATEEIYRRIVDRAAELGAVPAPGTKDLPIHLPDPGGSKQRYSLFSLGAGGEVYFGWFAPQLEKNGHPSSIAWDMLDEIAALFDEVGVNRNADSLTRTLAPSEVGERLDEFIGAVASAVTRLRRAIDETSAEDAIDETASL